MTRREPQLQPRGRNRVFAALFAILASGLHPVGVARADLVIEGLNQRQQLQSANDDLDRAQLYAKVSEGVWGAVSALCGYNCFNYAAGLMTKRSQIQETATQAVAKAQQAFATCNTAVWQEVVASASNPALLASAQADQIMVVDAHGIAVAIDTELAPLNADNAQENAQASQATAQTTAQSANPAAAQAPAAGAVAPPADTYSQDVEKVADSLRALSKTATAMVGPGPKAQCEPLNQSQADAGKLTAELQAYNDAIAKVKSVGKYCAIAGAAVSAGDLGYSIYQSQNVDKTNPYEKQLANQSATSFIGMGGAGLTSAYGLYAEFSHTDSLQGSSGTATSVGLASCGTAGFGIFQVVSREMDRESWSKEESKNQNSLNGLQSDRRDHHRVREFLTWLSEAERLTRWLPDLGSRRAYASAPPAVSGLIPQCQASSQGSKGFLACARAVDPTLARAFDGMPGGEEGLLSVLERSMGVSRTFFLTPDAPATTDQIIQLMTAKAPERRASVLKLVSGLREELGQHHITLAVEGVAPPAPAAAAAPSLVSPSMLAPARLPVARDPAGGAPETGILSAPPQDPAAPDLDSLFGRVSRRYGLERERAERLDWGSSKEK